MLRVIIVVVVLGYVVVVKKLRLRRRDSVLRGYHAGGCQSFASMTLDDAFAIQVPLAELEFPFTFSTSIFFALFKTYGIPSISKLLVATGELSDPITSSKRAADTGVLITEIVLNKPRSSRNLDAIARMNWLHARYRKAGKITDDDMLYTLSLFVLEPIRWTSRFEWRDLTDLETCALAVYWKHLGEVMDIPYDKLPSSTTGWRDGLQWLEELEAWSKVYEDQHRVPDEHNKTLTRSTIEIALTNVPRAFHGLSLQFVAALLEPQLRQAMMLMEPTPLVCLTLNMVVDLRKFLLKYFSLPRPDFLRVPWFTQIPDPSTGRYHFMQYIGHPWYINPTLGRRWNLNSWLLWLTGGYVPSSQRPEYRPEGYKIAELGPASLEGKGLDEMEKRKPIIAQKFRGCPFPYPK